MSLTPFAGLYQIKYFIFTYQGNEVTLSVDKIAALQCHAGSGSLNEYTSLYRYLSGLISTANWIWYFY